jgi:O-antigen/teichoic acid export membrane protein
VEDSLKKRYTLKLVSNIVNGLINIVLVAIVPKALGPVAFGQFNYLQQFFSQLISFLDAGSSMAFFTKLSAKTDRRELIVFYGVFTFFLLILLLIVGFGIHFFDLSHQFLPDIPVEYIYFGLWFGFLTWVTQVYTKISDAFALSVSVELIKSTHKIISMLLLVGLVYSVVLDLSFYFYFHYASLLSFLLLITLLFMQKGIFTKSLWTVQVNYSSLIQEFVHFCSPLLVFNIVGILAGLFDIWLLQTLGGSVQSGFYGLAYSIAAMCFLFTSAMTPIITREFAKYYEQHELENIKKLFYRYIPMLYSVSAYFAVFIAFQSEKLVGIFTDEKFKEASIVLMVMAFYPIHQTYGQLSGSLFFATNKTRLYKNIGIIASVIGVILTLIFLYVLKLEALGLAWKMVLVQILSVTIQLYFNCKFLDISMKYFITHQLYSMLFFVACAFLSQNLFFKVDSLALEFLILGCVYTLFVAIGGLIFPQIFALTLREIKQGLKR